MCLCCPTEERDYPAQHHAAGTTHCRLRHASKTRGSLQATVASVGPPINNCVYRLFIRPGHSPFCAVLCSRRRCLATPTTTASRATPPTSAVCTHGFLIPCDLPYLQKSTPLSTVLYCTAKDLHAASLTLSLCCMFQATRRAAFRRSSAPC